MDSLTGKELDDSIFNNDSHLDWADEVMEEPIVEEPHPNVAEKQDEGVGNMSTSPKPTGGPGGRRNKGGRQLRQSGRSQRGSADFGNGYNGVARNDQTARSASRGRPRSRGARSSSRAGYNSQQPQQQMQPGTAQPQSMTGGSRQGRDRSLSTERSGSIGRARNWRGSTPSGSRARADMIDRWEHDKFDVTAGSGPRPPIEGSNTRARRNSTSVYNTRDTTANTGLGIEQIGKEGISHVTINRRDSNASSRPQMSASYDQFARRQASGINAYEAAADVAAGLRHGRQPFALHANGSSLQQVSPQSPSGSVGAERYRAPHRRQSSADDHPPLPQNQLQQPVQPPTLPNLEDTLNKEANEYGGSSPEMEWENFVANGGLEIPFESITDELLKHPQRSVTSHQQQQQKSRRQGKKPQLTREDRTERLLNDDKDYECDTSDNLANGGRRASVGSRRNAVPRNGKPEQGISIRGSAKKAAANSEGKSSRTKKSNLVARGRESPVPPKQQRQQQQQSARNLSGGQIKGAKATDPTTTTIPNGGRQANARTLSRPSRSVAPPSPSRSPTLKPDTPPLSRPLSRSSSNDGHTQQSGTIPSSYLRRQYEVHDEDRGRHVFSVNIPYSENRFAPIHVHERDDLENLAAKFARIWRVNNEEQKIKRMLTKIMSVMLEDSL
ncbi:hypothetical protein COEREDRAFT_79411 [Coemansia reversa NRRL 1564]|uniref:Uncharacterized protein n=1 Tax=Coemansia reversa (strain ATCC 12441 / NRRL 1564) TaxID=763665 RepID=A0A2G5BIL0_COERN|nr:hypothetical protein COEREDRAFT_79411 [Coemansia reversa NRRL 1564]|eukprot:PIA18860.1 hypothetical protein COEREDRAFT_79411 [Coemansia reversa NRRL 1564]